MATPTILSTPALGSTIQVATPFDYTFYSSGTYQPPPLVEQPVFTASVASITYNYVSQTSNTALVSFPVKSTSTKVSISGTFSYPIADCYSSGGVTFKTTFLTQNVSGSPTVRWTSNVYVIFSSGTVRFNTSNITPYSYSSSDYLQYTIVSSNSFTASLVIGGTPHTIGPYVDTTPFLFQCSGGSILTNTNADSVTITAPSRTTYFPLLLLNILVTSQTSQELLQYLSGSGTSAVYLRAPSGFQSIPSSNLTLALIQTYADQQVGPLNQAITITPISFTSTPSLPGSLSLAEYTPFSYTFAVSPDAVNVVLQTSNTSPTLLQYLNYNATEFSGSNGFTSTFSNAKLQVDAVVGSTVLGSLISYVTSTAPLVSVIPPIPTGSLNLYSYEPFSYIFTTPTGSSGLVIQFNRSSSLVSSYCSLSSDGQTMTYAGTYLTSSSSIFSLVVDLVSDTTIISTTTILISIGRGRFYPPTPNQNYQLFQYEDISTTYGSNIPFLTVVEADLVFSVPSLPAGLSFGSYDPNTWFLQGTPTLRVAQSNYAIFGSNISSGRIVSVPISIKVNSQQLTIAPAISTISGLRIGQEISPRSFVATEPATVTRLYFQYTWAPDLLDGFSFQDPNGAPISQGYTSNSIQLAGTPTLAAASYLASNSLSAYSVRLTGTQYQGGGNRITGSSLITFSFVETVLFAGITIPVLYATENMNYKNVIFSAATFFASGSPITSIVASSLPTGLSLSTLINGTVQLIGTPTVVDQVGTAYSLTATNANGTVRTQSFTIPILPDIITFSSDTPADNTAYSYIVSKPITPITFTATSSANKTITSWVLSLSTSVYGLYLNTISSGIVQLVGVPTAALGSSTITITATDSLGTIAVKPITITIVADTASVISQSSFSFLQNIAFAPVQVALSTASGRQIQSFSATGLPTGVIMSTSGLVSGTPTSSTTSGTVTVTATTGYSTFTLPFPYTLTKDLIVVVQSNASDPVPQTGSSIQMLAPLQYSSGTSPVGTTWSITNILPYQQYPIVPTVSASGVLSFDFTGVYRLGGYGSYYMFPSYCVNVRASAGTAYTDQPMLLTFPTTPVSYLFTSWTETYTGGYNTNTPSGTGYVFGANATGVQTNTLTWSNSSYPATNRATTSYVKTDLLTDGVDGGTVVLNDRGRLYYINNNLTNVWSPPAFTVATNLPINLLVNGSYVLAIAQKPVVGGLSQGFWGLYHHYNGFTYVLIGDQTGGVWTQSYNVSSSIGASLGTTSPVTITSYGNGSYAVASGAASTVFLTTNSGSTWTSKTLTQTGISKLIYGNSTLVAIGPGTHVISKSVNSGVTWTAVTSPLSGATINDIYYANGNWVAVGSSTIIYSTDLVTWSTYSSTDSLYASSTWSSISYNGNAWSILGSATVGGNYVSRTLSLDARAWGSQTAVPIVSGSVFSFTPTSGSSGIQFTSSLPIITAIDASAQFPGTISIPLSTGLAFSQPESSYRFYQYVPVTIPVQVLGTTDFIYYFSTATTPIGFTFARSADGITASFVGTPSQVGTFTIMLVAKTLTSSEIFKTVTFEVINPYFLHPQNSASAYIAQLKNQVEANGAQNARDNRTFPQVDPLAGPLMAPRAPDVVTALNCFLKLCKKPCPTCRTMM